MSEPQTAPLTIVQVASLGTIGDNIYRVHQPCAALAQLPGVQVFEVHAQSRHRNAAALAADVLVLTMTLDVEVFRLIHQRRLLGKPTVCEVNDYLPDVQPWNPAHRTWADPRGQHLFEQLIGRSDAVQVSSAALGQRVAHLSAQLAVFDNQLAHLPAKREPSQRSEVVIGWGGSLGHLQDLEHIAPTLIAWLQRHPGARLEIMADPSLATPFAGVPPAQFQFHHAGSLAHYLKWLQGLDIGLAPLLPTPYNRCRSDVKFLEYASHGVVPVVQRLEPYATVRDGETGFLFDNPQHLATVLDQLLAAPALRLRVADAAYDYLHTQRRIEQHADKRLQFYRQQITRMQATPVPDKLPPLLTRASTLPLLSLPGWQSDSLGLSANHHRLDLSTQAEQHSAAGIEALQSGDITQACIAFTAAVRLDPSDAHAYSFLGHCLMKQGRLPMAREALERAMGLDPLLSRPVRALARLHRTVAEQYAQRAAQLNPLPEPATAR